MKRLAGVFLIALSFPLSAGAADVATLLAQLEALRAQIILLQNSVPAGASTACDLPTHTMRKGDSGQDVTRLQTFLARNISVYPEGTVSGFYGALTEAAVQRWQISRGIVSSGSTASTGFGAVGPVTLAAMKKEWCLQAQITPSPFTPPVGSVVPSAGNPAQSAQTNTANPAATQTSAPVVPKIQFTTPAASTSVTSGSFLLASWKSDGVPGTAVVTLSLKTKAGASVGNIKANLPLNGSYYWTVPASSQQAETGTCTADAITCLSQIAQTPTPCASICSLAGGLYKFYVQVFSGASEIAHAESKVFSVGGAPLASSDILSSGSTGNVSNFASLFPDGMSTDQTGTSTEQKMCLYSGVPYTEGISLTITCADVTVPKQGCGTFGGMQLTCKAGKWVDQNGAAQEVRNVTAAFTPGSCITPWMAQTVANGNEVPREPFFTDGVYASAGMPLLMKCSNGTWLTCSAIGDACHK